MDGQALKKQIGNKMKQLRVLKGWSRPQTATKLHMSANNYGCMERGEIDVPLTRLVDIAQTFEIPLSELLCSTEKNVFNFTKSQKNQTHRNQTHHTEYFIVGVNASASNDASLQSNLDKANLLLQEREKEIEYLKKQVLQLEEINSLLKNNQIFKF